MKGYMMRYYKKSYKILFILFILNAFIFACFFKSDYENVNAEISAVPYVSPADDEPANPDDLARAMKLAPRGLNIADPTFQQGFFTMNNSNDNMNSSKVISRNHDQYDKTGILRVTHNFNQLGAIWSNIDDSNFLDVSQDQSMSMWLYFGKPINDDKPMEVGDGMAFVLQNAQPTSSALNPFGGINAISRYNGNPAPGETLGVWGADFNNNGLLFGLPISKTAIPKSFAIEFDTFLNKLV